MCEVALKREAVGLAMKALGIATLLTCAGMVTSKNSSLLEPSVCALCAIRAMQAACASSLRFAACATYTRCAWPSRAGVSGWIPIHLATDLHG